MTTNWRPLTDAEIATWPKARLGGALLAIVIVTGVLSLALLAIILMFLTTLAMHGPEALIGMLAGGGQRYMLVGYISAAWTLVLLVGGLIVFVLSLARASATPAIASAGAVTLFCAQIVTNVVVQSILLEGNASLVATAMLPMIPQWLGGLLATAGFMGYMLGGVRPNAYFRRRVAVPPS